MLADLLTDVRLALRSAARAPVPFLVAALSIGIGIGANTLVFTWLDNLVLRPLPAVPDQQSLVAFNWAAREGEVGGVPPFSYPALQGWRDASRSFKAMAAEGALRVNLRREGSAASEAVWAVLTTANYFDVVGVGAMLGRTFAPDEEQRASPVAVLSEPFWRRSFDADSNVIGRAIAVNGTSLTIVGVAAPRFAGVTAGLGWDFWVPLSMQPYLVPGGSALNDRTHRWLRGVGRLAAGVTVVAASRELAAVAREQSAGAGERPVTSASVQRFRDQQLGSLLLPLLGAVLAVTALVLLLACANVANLLLVRAVARRREMGIRIALGAGRGRLVRQLLAESALLALAGGVVAILVTALAKGAFSVFIPPVPEPVSYSLDINARVVGLAAVAAGVTAFLFGLAPAVEASRPEIVTALRSGPGNRRGGRWHGILAVSQMAFSVAALFAAGLFLRSLNRVRDADLGIGDPERLLLVATDLALLRQTPAEADATLEAALARLRSLPGVSSVSAATGVPLGFGGHAMAPVTLAGYDFGPDESNQVERVSVLPGYFDAMGVRIVAGRPIDATDRDGTDGVAVVNEAFARRYWPGLDPIGRRITHGPVAATVVGVAKDGVYDAPGRPPYPLVYTAWRQWYRPSLTVLVRTAQDPRGSIETARAVIQTVNAELPFLNPRTMAEHMQASTFVQRLGGSVLGGLGAVALLMASLGLYAVIAHGVAQRTQEIGIRMALGESSGGVIRQVLARSARLALTGLLVGVAAAAGVGRVFRSQLIGVSPFDPLVLAVVGATLALASVAASLLPARRAARMDPLVVLRSQ